MTALCQINNSSIKGSGLRLRNFMVAISGLKHVHRSNKLLNALTIATFWFHRLMYAHHFLWTGKCRQIYLRPQTQ